MTASRAKLGNVRSAPAVLTTKAARRGKRLIQAPSGRAIAVPISSAVPLRRRCVASAERNVAGFCWMGPSRLDHPSLSAGGASGTEPALQLHEADIRRYGQERCQSGTDED